MMRSVLRRLAPPSVLRRYLQWGRRPPRGGGGLTLIHSPAAIPALFPLRLPTRQTSVLNSIRAGDTVHPARLTTLRMTSVGLRVSAVNLASQVRKTPHPLRQAVLLPPGCDWA